MKPKIFIISGSAGAGKDSVIKKIKESRSDLRWAITTTSKQPRDDETQGNPYYYISKKEFQRLIQEDGFLEYENVYGDNFFGMTRIEIQKALDSKHNIIWQMDYRGMRKVKPLFPDSIITIFILPPSLEIAKTRIEKRSNVSPEFVQERLELAKKEIEASKEYDYAVVNEEGRLEETVDKVIAIIDKHST